MASFNYQEYQNETKQQPARRSGVGYFNLKKNGEEAIVRFMYESPAEFNLSTVHTTQVNNKWRKVDCLNTPHGPNQCPLCIGNKAQRKFFIKLIQYVKDENGNIVPTPKIWERSDKYADTLSNLFKEYGVLSDSVFKIRRNGAEGDMHTAYDIMYATPTIYKPEIYVKDTTLFKDFDLIKNGFVVSMSADDMIKISKPATQTQPEPKPVVQQTPVQPTTPQYQPQPQQSYQQTYVRPTTQTQNNETQETTNFNNQPRKSYTY